MTSDEEGPSSPRGQILIRVAVALAVAATACGALWIFWKQAPAAPDRPSPFSDSGGPLSAVPGQEERRFPADLADQLERLDPAVDGWDTEVQSEAITEWLHKLEELLAKPGAIDGAALAALADPAYTGTPLRPQELRPVFESPATTVRRAARGGSAVRLTGVAGLARAIEELRQPFRASQARHLELKLVHITPEAGRLATEVDFQADGPSDAGRTQQNAIWHMRFTPPEAERPPLVAGIDLVEYEEVVGPADGSPLFADLTTSVLGRDPSFDPQIALGQVHWSGALDVMFGEQMLGHHGLAVGDVNGDGLDDLYAAQPGGLPNRLYVQQPDGTAVDVAADAGVDYLDLSLGVLLVDFDGDSDQDLVTASGPLVFHSNDGRGHFKVEQVVPTSPVFSLAAADYDLDGDLDLYACKYGSPSQDPPTPYQDANNGVPNLMLRNDGRFRFTDVTRESGLAENNTRFSFAAAWADYDEDGDPDLFVANDFGRDNLYRNDGGRFRDVAAEAGVDDISAGMSASWGDYDLDGHLDLYVGNTWSAAGNRTAFQSRFMEGADATMLGQFRQHAGGNTLFRNLGDGRFEDVSVAAGVKMGRWAWGSKFIDLNNDGWEDIFVANGYVTNDDNHDLGSFFWRQVVAQSPEGAAREPSKSYIDGWTAVYELIREGKSWSGRERKVCLLNTGDGTFADVSAMAGVDLADDGRALAVADWDLDGALDFWISNRTGPQLRFLRNLNKTPNHYSAVRLEGVSVNRDAIGARVELHRAGRPPLVRVLTAGDAYLAQSSKWVHFGLGDATAIDRVVVFWPGGAREQFVGVEADGRYRLVQGAGRAEAWTPPRARTELPPPRALPEPPRGAVRNYLVARLPLFGLDFLEAAGGRMPIATDGEHPLLVTLWASWCEHCRHELTELQREAARVGRSGLRVLALSVEEEAARPAAQEFLDSIGWSYGFGYADEESLDVLNIIRESIVEIPGGMVLPTSFLLDPRNELVAVYRGPVPLATLLGDAGTMALDPADRRDRAVPFAGRWVVPPPATRPTEGLANVLRGRSHPEIAAAYVQGVEMPTSAPEWAKERRAESLEYVGRALATEGKYEEAVVQYARALEIDPMRASAHHAMGLALVKLRRIDGGITHLEDALRLDPRRGGTHYDLGEVFAERGRLDDAIHEFRLAAELAPPASDRHQRALFNIGVALEAQGKPDEALDTVTRVLAAKPDFFDALRFLGYLHQQRNELRAAITYYDRALAVQPDEPRTLYQLALAHLAAGDAGAAREKQQALARVEPRAAEELLRKIERGGT